MKTYLYEALRRLVAFDTVSTNSNLAAIGFLAERFESHGFRVHLQELDGFAVPQANLVAWTGPPRPDGLIVSGHVDTVPFANQPGWERDPLEMEGDDQRVYGRGVADMKGFIAQGLAVAARLDHGSLARPLVFVFTAGEETGCLGARQAASALGAMLEEAPVPGLAWIGEPTSYRVQHAHKSIVLFDVRVRGRGGHSGAPAQGVNAIAVMAKAIDTIGRYQEELSSRSDQRFASIFPEAPCDVLNFGAIEGGIAANVIAEQCVLRISYRTLPDSDPLRIYREIETRLRALEPRDYGPGSHRATIELGEPLVVPAMFTPRGTRLEKVLLELTGASAVTGALFGTDGGWFASAGVKSLICGPGDFAQAHQPNESIERRALERGPDLILRVIEKIAGAGAS